MAVRATKVLVVDDHPLVREGLVMMLEMLPESPKVYSADTAARALEQAELHSPIDVIVLDVNLPDSNGPTLIAALRRRCGAGARVLAISGDTDARVAGAMISAGAVGFVSKAAPSRAIVDAVRDLLLGLNMPTAAASPDTLVLSARQLDVLLMLDSGLTNRDIALKLGVAEKTVKNHITALFHGLGASNRLAAIRKARDLGLLH